jgi:hypothetical protein
MRDLHLLSLSHRIRWVCLETIESRGGKGSNNEGDVLCMLRISQ